MQKKRLFQHPAEHIDTETEIDGPGGGGSREGGMGHIEAGPDGEFGKTFQGLHVVHGPVELEIGRDACLVAESGDLIRFLVPGAGVRRIIDETDTDTGKRRQRQESAKELERFIMSYRL